VSVPVEVQDKIGKKVLYSPVWRVPETEAAKLAWPHVQKFEAMIEGARTGKFVPVVEREAPGVNQHRTGTPPPIPYKRLI
jgi:hypothetical protein